MLEFNTSLLREKFSILDSDPESDEERAIIALSNRITVDLTYGQDKKHNESFVIRTQNMHSCVRMAARLLKSHKTGGPILNRQRPYDWEAAWDATVNDYEYRFNEDRWVAVYHNGQTIFQNGEHHPLLDVIEKCDARNKGNYDTSVKLAEDAFKQAGKVVTINHQSNVALISEMLALQGKFGVIVRGPTKTTTFNFSVTSKDGKEPINFSQCLSVCACYLEGVQLAFTLGMNHEKIRLGIIEQGSKEERQTRQAADRLSRLDAEISNLERACSVRYRPERPNFQTVLAESEKLAQQIIEKPKLPEPGEGLDSSQSDEERSHA